MGRAGILRLGYSRCFNRRPILSALGGLAVFLIGYVLWLAVFVAMALVMES